MPFVNFLLVFILYCECDDFCEDYESEEFYKDIQKGFLNFQKFFKV